MIAQAASGPFGPACALGSIVRHNLRDAMRQVETVQRVNALIAGEPLPRDR